MRTWTVGSISFLGLFLLVAQTVFAEGYSAEFIGSPDGRDVYLTDINNHGLAVGYVRDKQGRTEAIAVRNRKITHLGGLRSGLKDTKNVYQAELPDQSSVALALSDRGQIVGWAKVFDDSVHACLWELAENGKVKVKDLGTLGGYNSKAVDINNHGHIVGWSETEKVHLSRRVRHATSWHDGKIVDLGTLGGKNSWATSINDRFEIVGASDVADEDIKHLAGIPVSPQGFVYKEGEIRLFNPRKKILGHLQVWHITNTGAVVFTERTGVRILFVRKKNGTVVKFGAIKRGIPRGINEHGVILSDTGKNGITQVVVAPGKETLKNWTLLREQDQKGRPIFAGLNDRGVLCGSMKYGSRVYGVVASPPELSVVPEIPQEVPLQVTKPKQGVNRIVIFHGWNNSPKEEWILDLERIFKKKTGDSDLWKTESIDWEEKADTLRPGDAALNAFKVGREYGLRLSKENPKIIHLIGFSAGCRAVAEVARILDDEDTWVHVTFLDGYVPEPKRISFREELGQSGDFVEHYRDSRFISFISRSFGKAGPELPKAWNLDVANLLKEKQPKFFGPNVVGVRAGKEDLSNRHVWPALWYALSAGSGRGLDLAPIFRKEPVTQDDFPKSKDSK